MADNGDGTYRNAILHADNSDPDVLRIGEDYYLTASSFNAVPGLPILHSKDLVNWEPIGHAFAAQPPLDVYDHPGHGNGSWAPSIRRHNGEVYIFYPDPDFGIYMVKAKTPAGPWSDPLLVKRAKGWIDPCPLWDDDGKAYLGGKPHGSRTRDRVGVRRFRLVPRGVSPAAAGYAPRAMARSPIAGRKLLAARNGWNR